MSAFTCRLQKNSDGIKSSKSKNKRNNKMDAVYLAENERLPLQQKIREFLTGSDDEIVLHGLTNLHRKFLHQYAARLGLKSRSYGKKDDRQMHIRKCRRLIFLGDAHALGLSPTTREVLLSLVPAVQSQFIANQTLVQSVGCQQQRQLRGEALSLSLGPHMVPPRPQRIPSELLRDKQELPIHHFQNEIHQILAHHNVFIINGETGSGKTTQVPQYILSEATRRNRPCRIIVTQPRRVAAVSVANRVAEERGEVLGETVGYQIRMESRVCKTTNLIYTTSGCFLRSIMADVSDLFRKVSHLIIDEIHERDKNTDFTLISVKEQLKLNKDLRVILMSATMDIHLLSKYFDDCPVLNVPGQSFNVKTYHLEDILFYTGYRTDLMDKYLRSMDDIQLQNLPPNESILNNTNPDRLDDEALQQIFDLLIEQCCTLGNNRQNEVYEMFDQMQYYIESEGMSVNVGHSVTGITPLMAACKCNMPEYVRSLILRQANVSIRDRDGYEAIDYARLHSDSMCLQILTSSCNNVRLIRQQHELSQQDRDKHRLLGAYQQQFNDDNDVDHDLILSLLEGLYRSSHPGAIMVFLPGYNDIVHQKDLIQSTLPGGTYIICILHGQMDSKDQCKALQTHSVRKIILSTNIGQTSITIPDLAYIIDSGKVKMNTFDSITESSQLQLVWISQADACQRAGRAGRTQNGICYRLYSKVKYQFMSQFSIPEFMRIPLTEICLYAKILEPQSAVQNYLARALNPPSALSVQNALRKLKILGVLNNDESVTELGRHLVDIPLDVQLGKCLMYGVFLKCFDPILTICAYHSVKDPFVLPGDRSLQGQVSFLRKSFAGESFSDHMGILSLYKNYVAARNSPRKVKEFCAKYYLSQASMEMFCAIRRQIGELMKQKFPLGPGSRIHNTNWLMIQLCLVSGFYPNVAVIDRTNAKLICGAEKQLVLQRTSALNPPGKKHLREFIQQLPHDWIVFFEKSRIANTCSINMNTVVPPLLIALQCGHECDIDEDVSEENSDDDNNSDFSVWVNPGNENDNLSNNCDPAQRQLIKSLASVHIDSSGEERKAIMSLDNWIKFELSITDAKLLQLMRTALRDQFQIFLYSGQNTTNSNAAFYVQKLLNSLRPMDYVKKANEYLY
uniref:RNA helicase n=1 Tax=Glossina austeni TaxID=7395 RepID=A0A1A9UZM5_GLOAU